MDPCIAIGNGYFLQVELRSLHCINRIVINYLPLVTRQEFVMRKIKIFKCAETLKNEVFRPAAGGNFLGSKPIINYSPPCYSTISNKGGGNS